MTDRTTAACDIQLLRDQLTTALVQADLCDPLIAIHVETALALIDERFGPAAQSSSR